MADIPLASTTEFIGHGNRISALETAGVGTIANNAVTYAKMQDVTATGRVIGRISAGAGDPEELTGAQLTGLLSTFTTTLKGVVPASGGGTVNFLRADGTWAAPSGGGTTYSVFTSTTSGLVPASGGGTVNFLRADGTWAAPPTGSGTPVLPWRVAATGTGASQNLTLPETVGVNDVLVFVNGLQQEPTTNYTISGTTLTITATNGLRIEVYSRVVVSSGGSSDLTNYHTKSDLALTTPNGDSGAKNIGFNVLSADARARTLQDKAREHPSLLDFTGVVNSATTDNSGVIQKAINYCAASKQQLLIPAGNYGIGSTITVGHVGWTIIGEGLGSTSFHAMAGITDRAMFLFDNYYGRLHDIDLRGGMIAQHGMVFRNASLSRIVNCDAIGFKGHGAKVDMAYDPATGYSSQATTGRQNNIIVFEGGHYSQNGFQSTPTTDPTVGLTVQDAGAVINGVTYYRYKGGRGAGIYIANQADNNGCTILNAVANSNASHGVVLKGESNNINGGNIFNNYGYGVSFGEDSDASVCFGNVIENCWIESNLGFTINPNLDHTRGVYASAKSSRCIFRRKNVSTRLFKHADGDALEEVTASQGTRLLTNGVTANSGTTAGFVSTSGSMLDYQIIEGGINMWIRSGDQTTGDRSLYIVPQGNGRVIPYGDIDMNTGKVYRVAGNQVVGPRQAAIANHASDATVNAILTALRNHGLIAP